MNFKGPKNWPQPVGPLSVLDDHSRYLIALPPTAVLAANRCVDNSKKRFRVAEFRTGC